MKPLLLSIITITIITFYSCGEPPKYDENNTSAPSAALPASISDSNNLSEAKDNQTTLPATGAAAPVPLNGALNPQHGAPGHRCDIAVGAPLNSPVQPTQQTNPAPKSLPRLPQPSTNGKVTINPAHGLPGHDCSIPVGQPLTR